MRLVFAFASLVLTASVSLASDWKIYTNGRFGFSVEVPKTFKSLPPPLTNDGLAFVSKDENAKITAYGHYLQSKYLADDERQQENSSEDLHITYRQVASGTYVLSGTEGKQIVYIRAVKTCRSAAVAILRADYPQSAKVQFDPLIAHMAQTLRGSNACWK